MVEFRLVSSPTGSFGSGARLSQVVFLRLKNHQDFIQAIAYPSFSRLALVRACSYYQFLGFFFKKIFHSYLHLFRPI